MPQPFRALRFLFLTAVAFSPQPSPAFAATHHWHHHHHTAHTLKKQSPSRVSIGVRTAQTHLWHLGYYHDHMDGVMGPHTVAALKSFQHDHRFAVTGKLTTQTYNALVEADRSLPTARGINPLGAASGTPTADFYKTHPDFYGHVHQQYTDPMVNSTAVIGNETGTAVRSQSIPSRFGKLDLSEDAQGVEKKYNLTLNGQSILTSEQQPSAILVSRTYELANEDAIIITSYQGETSLCPYRHYLLTLHDGGNNVIDVPNCSRGYQALVDNGLLNISFPDNDGNVISETYRYDTGHLERL